MNIIKNEEKDKSISLDDSKKFNEDVQKLTDDFISQIDKTFRQRIRNNSYLNYPINLVILLLFEWQ